jgi:hypothetical protein
MFVALLQIADVVSYYSKKNANAKTENTFL